MSLDYAAGLSHYDDLGVCGLDEVFDDKQTMQDKVKLLARWLVHYSGSCVVHVGAGLSTAAGIPDFRGKNGVWTKMLASNSSDSCKINDKKVSATSINLKKEPPEVGDSKAANTNNCDDDDDVVDDIKSSKHKVKPFDETKPTLGHMVLRELCRAGYIKHIISQNVDGLFLKANFERRFVSELHGNFYLDECTKCKSRFIRGTASETMRLTRSAINCPRSSNNNNNNNHNNKQEIDVNSSSSSSNKQKQVPTSSCSGYLRDTILDWESPIPYNELRRATREAKQAKLHICVGTSLQLRPSKDLVCKPPSNDSKSGGNNKLVIINLQPTQINQKASLIVNQYADDVLRELAKELDLEIPDYDPSEDPTKKAEFMGSEWKKE